MRKDMSKVLVTTPRIGSSNKNFEVKKDRRSFKNKKNHEDLPSYSSMKPRSSSWEDRKSLNEYLNPLIRYLNKNVGRPWDKVYSDICKNMDKRTPVQAQHTQTNAEIYELELEFFYPCFYKYQNKPCPMVYPRSCLNILSEDSGTH
jgi:hypothetical protein